MVGLGVRVWLTEIDCCWVDDAVREGLLVAVTSADSVLLEVALSRLVSDFDMDSFGDTVCDAVTVPVTVELDEVVVETLAVTVCGTLTEAESIPVMEGDAVSVCGTLSDAEGVVVMDWDAVSVCDTLSDVVTIAVMECDAVCVGETDNDAVLKVVFV